MGLWKSQIWLSDWAHTHTGHKTFPILQQVPTSFTSQVFSAKSSSFPLWDDIKGLCPFSDDFGSAFSHCPQSHPVSETEWPYWSQTLPRLLCLRPLGTEPGLKFTFPFLPPDPQVPSTHCSSAHVPTSESWGITWVNHVKAFKWVEMLILGLPKLMISPFLG